MPRAIRGPKLRRAIDSTEAALTDEWVERYAERSSLIWLTYTYWTAAKVAVGKAANPNCLFALYRSAMEIWEDDAAVAGFPETAFLHWSLDAPQSEYRLKIAGYTMDYAMNQYDSAWLANRAASCAGPIADRGYNALFFDGASPYVGPTFVKASDTEVSAYAVNPGTGDQLIIGTPSADEYWKSGGIAFLDAIRAEVGSSIPFFTNGYGPGTWFIDYGWGTSDPDEFIQKAGIILGEGALRPPAWSIGSWKTEADWVKEINAIIYIQSKGISCPYPGVAVNATLAESRQIDNYCLCSYLLGADIENSYYWFREDNFGRYWDGQLYKRVARLGPSSETFTDIASAKNRLTNGANTYHRAFAGGLVLVNPTASNDTTVTLPTGTWYDRNGTAYIGGTNTIAVNAHEGKILTDTF